ncbi:cyclic pyranopterin monophosphate synthase MoaC [bacterium]
MEFTHFNDSGKPRMVDISGKKDTKRVAIATGKIKVTPETIEQIKGMQIKKGDVLSVSQVAGIMGAKETSRLIPMTHNINLTGVDIRFDVKESEIVITSEIKTFGKTGAEMEALTAVSLSALTIYDMCKAIDKNMIISDIKLTEKTGGKSDFKETK